MIHAFKKLTAWILIWIILAPLLLPAIVATGAEKLAAFIDWVFAERWITQKLTSIAVKIETWIILNEGETE